MANNSYDFMKDILATPLGELISSVGAGVAEAQAALDAGSLAQTLAIYNSENKDELTSLMREVGYQPTFYALPETEVEAQISLSLSVNNEIKTSSGPTQSNNLSKTKIYVTPANASSTNRFNLNVNAFSKIKFKIVPVPPPGEAGDMRVIPNLVGKTEAEAALILNQLGLKYTVIPKPQLIPSGGKGNTLTSLAPVTTISVQNPLGGSIGKAGTPIELTI